MQNSHRHYSRSELFGWYVRNIFGFSKNNPGNVRYIPKSYVITPELRTQCRLTFIGDIMPMRGRRMRVSPEVSEFIRESELLVGNFEATITDSPPPRPKLWTISFYQRQNKRIMDDLAEVFPPEKTCLCLSNNHAGDFGKEEFYRSVETLEAYGFRTFGLVDHPFFDFIDNIRIIAGSMWSNHMCKYIVMLESAEKYIRQNAFNILYPHFGFELELYPRLSMINLGRNLLHTFDAIIGHHSHCPQPVSVERINGDKKLLAYTLGDFCTGLKIEKYHYGIILKIELGQKEKWHIGKIEWQWTKCSYSSNGDFVVSLIDKFPE